VGRRQSDRRGEGQLPTCVPIRSQYQGLFDSRPLAAPFPCLLVDHYITHPRPKPRGRHAAPTCLSGKAQHGPRPRLAAGGP
jgi:hypothetical protein